MLSIYIKPITEITWNYDEGKFDFRFGKNNEMNFSFFAKKSHKCKHHATLLPQAVVKKSSPAKI